MGEGSSGRGSKWERALQDYKGASELYQKALRLIDKHKLGAVRRRRCHAAVNTLCCGPLSCDRLTHIVQLASPPVSRHGTSALHDHTALPESRRSTAPRNAVQPVVL